MRIKVNKDKCSGCRLCETLCSLFHLGVVNTERSAIRIEKDDLNTSMNAPFVCRQCKTMKCLEGEKAAPEAERAKFVWSAKRSKHCPFRALPVFGGKAYHCDLCGGDPQCVKVCTTGALVTSPSFSVRKRWEDESMSEIGKEELLAVKSQPRFLMGKGRSNWGLKRSPRW